MPAQYTVLTTGPRLERAGCAVGARATLHGEGAAQVQSTPTTSTIWEAMRRLEAAVSGPWDIIIQPPPSL